MNYGKKIEKVVVTGMYGMAEVIPDVLMSGQVCRVDYQKENGDITTMLCRTGVKKHLTGTGKSQTNLAEGRLSVWAFDRKGYRTLKMNGILTIKHGGIMYDFRNYHAMLAMRDGDYGEAARLLLPEGEYDVEYEGRTYKTSDDFVLNK
jgi:hypothetical protein